MSMSPGLGMPSASLLVYLLLALLIHFTSGETEVKFSGQTVFVVNETSTTVIRLVIERTGKPANITAIVSIDGENTGDFFDTYAAAFIPDTETNRTVYISVCDDDLPEADETFTFHLTLPKPSARIKLGSPKSVTVTILSNDNAFGIISFNMIEDGPNPAEEDLSPARGNITFTPGRSILICNLTVLDDQIPENDELFVVHLRSVEGGAEINNTKNSIQINIKKNDSPVRFVQSAYLVPEEVDVVTIQVVRGKDVSGKLIGPDEHEVSVSYAIVTGNSTAHAQLNVDFLDLQPNTTIVFPPLVHETYMKFKILDDAIPEIAETFQIMLLKDTLQGDAVLINPSVVHVTIQPNDKPHGVLSINSILFAQTVIIDEDQISRFEGITVVRNGGTHGNVSVAWVIIRNSSDPSPVTADLVPETGEISFDQGQMLVTLPLSIINDDIPEEAEPYLLKLLAHTIQGGAEVSEPSELLFYIQDSDDVYGLIKFYPLENQKIESNPTGRFLSLSFARGRGTVGDVQLVYTALYIPAGALDPERAKDGILNMSRRSILMFPEGKTQDTLNIPIRNDAFLQNGAHFLIQLEKVELVNRIPLVPPVSPRLGEIRNISLRITPDIANGEIGFTSNLPIILSEPEDSPATLVSIALHRDGTDGQATVFWSLKPSGLNQKAVTPDDISPFNGSVVFLSGQSDTTINITIKADDIPEMNETVLLTLDRVSVENQILKYGFTTCEIIILENDDPGGVFEFSPSSRGPYSIKEGESVELQIVRSRGSLLRQFLRYTVEPRDNNEFYGSTGILEFKPGEKEIIITLLTRMDGIPELDEIYSVVLSGYSEMPGKLGNATVVNITILKNDDPHGVIQFLPDELPVTIKESKGEIIYAAAYRVVRNQGSYGNVSVSWVVDPACTNDVYPEQGTIFFENLEFSKNITIYSLPDEVPEEMEVFIISLFNATGGARLGNITSAFLQITRNDDPIYFAEPLAVSVKEGSVANFTVLRNGSADVAVAVQYITVNGDATAEEGDFVPSGRSSVILFDVGEREQNLSVYINDDDTPETDETFYIFLLNSTGDTVIFKAGVATVIIEANDDPNGIFSLETLEKTVEEGKSNIFLVLRHRGHFGNVSLTWQLFDNGSALRPGEEFYETYGTVFFMDGEGSKPITLHAISDRIPEFNEFYILELVNASGGSPGPGGQLSETNLAVTVMIPFNDDPFGVFVIDPASQDREIVEDVLSEDDLSYITDFTIWRQQGTFGVVRLGWEILSSTFQHGLPSMVDFLLLGSFPSSVQSQPHMRRRHSGTDALYFSGKEDAFGIIGPEYPYSGNNAVTNFTFSAWLIPNVGTDGYVVEKDDDNGTLYYGVKIQTNDSHVSVVLQYTALGSNMTYMAKAAVLKYLDENAWLHFLITLDEGIIEFYMDGIPVLGGMKSLKGEAIADGPGIMRIGAGVNGSSRYTGLMQDVRLYERKLTRAEIYELHATPAKSDVHPVSGYLEYRQGETNKSFIVSAKDDKEEEGEELFILKLISVRGGARISQENTTARLRIQKSDNANGLFGFTGACIPEVLNLHVIDDDIPELNEYFRVTLVSAVSGDGKLGSTPTSGASIDPEKETTDISIKASDHPYGLLQFSVGPPPQPDGEMILPASAVPHITIKEEVGRIRLLVVRAQGLLGTVLVEYRTVPLTAFSPKDYQAVVGTLEFQPGERYKYITVNITDNSIPELEKTFKVELLNPEGGASLGIASHILVTIEASDDAHGVFEFSTESLSVNGTEPEDGESNVVLQVVRTHGALSQVTLHWIIVCDLTKDLISTDGNITFDVGQARANITVQVSPDEVPELDKVFSVLIINVSSGHLGNHTNATLTILANDDPYGVFIFSERNRPIKVEEETNNISLSIIRRGGLLGTVMVTYRTIGDDEKSPFLLPDVVRAIEGKDYIPITGYMIFAPNESEATISLPILDDDDPERSESVFVELGSIVLIEKVQDRPIVNSPRLGLVGETIAHVIINANDDAFGTLQLSASTVRVAENYVGPIINVTRTGGLFADVSVKFKAMPITATAGEDYSVASSDVVLLEGETSKAVPIYIINDINPEVEESFYVQLLNQTTGGALLGSLTRAVITIEASDDPFGSFVFQITEFTVEEPEFGSVTISLPIIRNAGTLGNVTVQWVATINGHPADADLQVALGNITFAPGEAIQMLLLEILADDVPEIEEIVHVELTQASNGGAIGLDGVANIIIPANDNPYGTVFFHQSLYRIQEPLERNLLANITVRRSGGRFGQLQIFYSTSETDVVALAIEQGQDILACFESPVQGIPDRPSTTRVNVSAASDPLYACATQCLKEQACSAFTFSSASEIPLCLWLTSELSPFANTSGFWTYKKNVTSASALFSTQAIAGSDYESVTGHWAIMEEGEEFANLTVTVLPDSLPELDEKFTVLLLKVELMNVSTSLKNQPTIGQPNTSTVIIMMNGDAFGVFKIYSVSPNATEKGLYIEVEERPQTNVQLMIHRTEGSLGQVTVEWRVVGGTATPNLDFVGAGEILVFAEGETKKMVTLTILDDPEPEDNESIIISLVHTEGGSRILPSFDTVTVIILASDNVAGIISFQTASRSVIGREGEQLQLHIVRTAPGLGNVTVEWKIVGHNVKQNFENYSGILFFPEETLNTTLYVHLLDDHIPEEKEEYQIILYNVKTEGVSPSGAAVLDSQGYEAVLTVEASDEPHGVLNFASPSRVVLIPEENKTVPLFINREFGSLDVEGLASQIIIDANDGVSGVVQWESTNFEVNESHGNLTIMAYRNRGSYGNVSVFFYAQNLEAQLGLDFNVTSRTLFFADGERNKSVVVTIFDDDIPEGDEKLQLILTNPSLGLELGENTTEASVDLTPSQGYIVLEEGVRFKTLHISAILDEEPEMDEHFIVTLFNPTGGARLGTRVQTMITVLQNQAPLGLFSIYPVTNRTNFLIIEEANTTVYLKVSRSNGLNVSVSVEWETLSDTAFGIKSGNSSEIFIWETGQSTFRHFQSLPVCTVGNIHVFMPPSGLVHILVSGKDTTALYSWNSEGNQFSVMLEAPYADHITSATARSLNSSKSLIALSVESNSQIYELTSISNQSDFIPSSGELIFESGDMEAVIAVNILDDIIPEEEECFKVWLKNPKGGAEIGAYGFVNIIIPSNDNAYGVIAFAQSSLFKQVEEMEQDSLITLNIERLIGTYGRVSVEWIANGSISDVFPASGMITFSEGQALSTITLTILADSVAELSETVEITLTHVTTVGVQDTTKGAVIDPKRARAVLTILPSDSPHGVIGWHMESLFVTVTEPEGQVNSTTLTLQIVREQGFVGEIAVHLSSTPNFELPVSNQATENEDYILEKKTIVMAENTTITSVVVTILPDNVPELQEGFIINITDVQLVDSATGGQPSVKRLGLEIAEITIEENDDARGVFSFNVTKDITGAVAGYEVPPPQNTLKLPVVRQAGRFGSAALYWEAILSTASFEDFTPSFGNLTFADGQATGEIEITIIDDSEVEFLEIFQIALVRVTGGARLGDDTLVTVAIPPNDSPVGVFGFEEKNVTVKEPQTSDDSAAVVLLTVSRSQGGRGAVKVLWILEEAARYDLTPLNGTLHFNETESQKLIVLHAVQDGLLEGNETFTIQLVSTGDAEISPVNGVATIIILGDEGASGVVGIAHSSKHVLIGEPLGNYNGTALISLIRGPGIFGEIIIYWNITPPHHTEFIETSGTLTMRDRQSAAVVLIQVNITIVRSRGSYGKVHLCFQIINGTAEEGIDFTPTVRELLFEPHEESKMILVEIHDDDFPEGPEDFSVMITKVELQGSGFDFTIKENGLQMDQPPIIGNISTVRVTIAKSDNAEGIIEFDPQYSLLQVEEDAGLIMIPVVRKRGTYGYVTADFLSRSISALPNGVDYVIHNNSVIFYHGQNQTFIYVTIIDDEESEFAEQFEIQLMGATGGAILGLHLVSQVTIAKSDSPQGIVRFLNQSRIILPNPDRPTAVSLVLERTGRLLGETQINWDILGPNSEEVLSPLNSDIGDPVNGSFYFGEGEGGLRAINLQIYPHEEVEVQEIFIIRLSLMKGETEIDPKANNITLIIQKFGDPNGIVQFAPESLAENNYTEPSAAEGPQSITLFVRRIQGTMGNITVYWEIRSESDITGDFLRTEGSVVIADQQSTAEIIIYLLPDDVPELDENYVVQLVSVEGGADLDQEKRISKMNVFANDDPHGVFALYSDQQSVLVERNLDRYVQINVTRHAGAFGEVIVEYHILSHHEEALIAPENEVGYLTVKDGASFGVKRVPIHSQAFLLLGLNFTLELINVSLVRGSAKDVPKILGKAKSAVLLIPEEAANSQVGFESVILRLTDIVAGTGQAVITRKGVYGSVIVSWISGYPPDLIADFAQPGNITPPFGTVVFSSGEQSKVIAFQATPSLNKRESFAITLMAVHSNVSGGARLRSGFTIAEIEPMGIFQFALNSRSVSVEEDVQAVTLHVQRLFGFQSNLTKLTYQTIPGSAKPLEDFIPIYNGELMFLPFQTNAVIEVSIIDDTVSEMEEFFFVNLTAVEILDVQPVDATWSPRLNPAFSVATVNVLANDILHGILSLGPEFIYVEEDANDGTPNTVTLHIRRTKGFTGDIEVIVKTFGGVSAQSGVDSYPFGNVYGKSNFTWAMEGEDFEEQSVSLTLLDGERESKVSIKIFDDDEPEGQELFYVFLSNPECGAQIVEGKDEYGFAAFATVIIAGSDLQNGILGFVPEVQSGLVLDEDSENREVLLIVTRQPDRAFEDVKIFWRVTFNKTAVVLLKDGMNLENELVSVLGATTCMAGQTMCNISIEIKPDNELQKPEPIGRTFISPAVAGQDFARSEGFLTFEHGQRNTFLDVTLTPKTGSLNPFPKRFQVVLSNPTGGARVADGYGIANVTIVSDLDSLPVWGLIDQLHQPLDDTILHRVLQNLNVKVATETTEEQLTAVLHIIDKVTDVGEKQLLTDKSRSLFYEILCALASPKREDTRGYSLLAEVTEKFAFSLLTGIMCGSPGERGKNILDSCPYIAIMAHNWFPQQINGHRFDGKDGDSIQVPEHLLEVSVVLPPQEESCESVQFTEYSSQQWFLTGDKELALKNKV
ncbi:adhesion G-protein coupled receptor V1 [Grus japonensis]|uniref:Adhesion G-protein coupled receptor V1 n=1 Tax=Grus japonensis TaxID=30415 RepID=A0ABC9Y9C6_GRUJA